MATYDNVINYFITENNLDEEIKDSLINLVNDCMGGYIKNMSKEWLVSSVNTTTTKKSVTKVEKLEDPSQAESIDDLDRCTSVLLNAFCKEKGLRVGGNKKEIKERVWRFIQGSSSEEDISPRSKPKKETVKKSSVKHDCSSCNAKGAPCKVSGTEELDGNWYCFRHITVAKKNKSDQESEEESESESEPEDEKPFIKKPSAPKKK